PYLDVRIGVAAWFVGLGTIQSADLRPLLALAVIKNQSIMLRCSCQQAWRFAAMLRYRFETKHRDDDWYFQSLGAWLIVQPASEKFLQINTVYRSYLIV